MLISILRTVVCTLRACNAYTPFVETTRLPYQAAVLVLADEERLHTVLHLISPRWFHPDEVLEVTRIHCRQDPILDTELTEKRETR